MGLERRARQCPGAGQLSFRHVRQLGQGTAWLHRQLRARETRLQKRIAQTDEIVGSVLYLASDMSSFTTGSTLVTDGGYLTL